MRRAAWILVALVASGAPAVAQPVTVHAACEIQFVRVPDDVRHVIESWLQAEPRCASTIDLRVVPTDGGYYVMAQRPDGRLHERIVPDAQSAGVLVASWVADDWVEPRVAEIAPVSTERVPPVLPLHTVPGESPQISTAMAQRRGGITRWLTAGVMLTPENRDGGLRAEIDLISRGRWTLGASLAWSETGLDLVTAERGGGYMRSNDVKGTLYGAYTRTFNRWELRAAIGGGPTRTESAGNYPASTTYPSMTYFHRTGTGVAIDVSLQLTRRIGDRWGVSAGPLATRIIQTLESDGIEPAIMRDDLQLFAYASLRRQI